ncbi:ThiF family protein [Pontibacter ummariensis]|uniref:ThiF family protein n=1 Tax=Pontibacter ummariensis TaxID=1610492 RepID=A0A239DS84_9BACT|nr:ThiF family adenylyltransferase [Pontibacter ummariensis]PRY13773.1 ThiF family protein [Pontibacter ummariensis]SNS35475.1 ThiF family protein [Pontibacter ummariensis]
MSLLLPEEPRAEDDSLNWLVFMSEFDLLALDQSRVLMERIKGVQLLGNWEPAPSSDTWMVRLRLELLEAEPTSEVPRFTEWVMVVDFRVDAWGKVQVHPDSGEGGIRHTFEHQQYNGGPHAVWPVRNGHICCLNEMHGLAASRNAMEAEPVTTIERLVWHVQRALEWVRSAADGTLAKAGDPFELPDFNVGFKGKTVSLAYYEDAESFSHWQRCSAYSGVAPISYLNGVAVIRQFLDRRGKETVHAPAWGQFIDGMGSRNKALWLRLETMPVVNRWQVPATLTELRSAVAADGKDLEELLKTALERVAETEDLLLLVGMPVPRRVQEAPYRYHWQALELFPKLKGTPAKSRVPLVLNRLRSSSPATWVGRSENWHPEDLQSRGRVTRSLREANILLIGAGALGANLAEQLVRMGVIHLTVVDHEPLEAGNLVRHTLDLPVLNISKAVALAERLNRVSPSAKVKGIASMFTSKDASVVVAAQSATLIIDATASDDVLRELPLPGITGDVPIISLSLGLHSRRLFFYADVAASFGYGAFSRWFAPYREEEHQEAVKQELPRGLGCWHPLTPARLNRVLGLAGCAVELIEQVCEGQVSLPVGYCHRWQVAELGKEVAAEAAP